MEFRDDQVERYSRQLLLREVGGPGQRALLATALETSGDGPALEVAVAYLAASGVAVRRAGRRSVFGAWNPDSAGRAPRPVNLQLGSAPLTHPDAVRAPAVWVGAVPGGGARLVVMPAGCCPLCAAQSLAGLEAVLAGPGAVLAGAHAALAVARWVMGWHGAVGTVVELGPLGETQQRPLDGCAEHCP